MVQLIETYQGLRKSYLNSRWASIGPMRFIARASARIIAYPLLRLVANMIAAKRGMVFPKKFDWDWKLEMLLWEYESETVALCKRLIKPGMNVVDAGAHIGYYTLLFSELVGPSGKVYAFEPHPDNFPLLLHNTRCGKYHNVVPVQKAISDQIGLVKLFESTKTGSHSLYDSEIASGQTFVETTTLDAFLVEIGAPPVHLIKMDIQGAEPAALIGMSDLIARSKQLMLIVEYCPGCLMAAGINPSAFLRQLSAAGLSIFAITSGGKLVNPEAVIHQLARWQYVNLLCEK
jgi:FkbM family methyltransferase